MEKPKISDFKIPITSLGLPEWDELKDDFKEVIDSKMITNNKFVKQFEKELQDYLDVPNAVCVNSGTSALILSLKALKESNRIKGNEVILPSFTFISTANAVMWAGLKPVFVDCDKNTFNIDPEKIDEAITKDTAVIMPVHIFGNPCPIKEISEIAVSHEVGLVYDSCEAFGAQYHLRRIGSFNNIDVTSGAATKSLSISEAGIIGTEDDEIAEIIKEARNAGNFDSLKWPGLSARMTEFQAVMGIHQLPKVSDYIRKRNKIADLYKKELEDVEGISYQMQEDRCTSAWFSFPTIIDKNVFGVDRNHIQEELKKVGIWARTIWFDPPVHRHSAYAAFNNLKFPVTDYLSENILCLPMSSNMTEEDAIQVCEAIKRCKK